MRKDMAKAPCHGETKSVTHDDVHVQIVCHSPRLASYSSPIRFWSGLTPPLHMPEAKEPQIAR